MSQGRLELARQPGRYISGARARWLLQGRRARMTSDGKLEMLDNTRSPRDRGGAGQERRTAWSSYSSCGARNLSATPWLAGYRMNGGALNRG